MSGNLFKVPRILSLVNKVIGGIYTRNSFLAIWVLEVFLNISHSLNSNINVCISVDTITPNKLKERRDKYIKSLLCCVAMSMTNYTNT